MNKNLYWLVGLLLLLIISCDDDPIEPEPEDPEAFVFYWKATVDGSAVSYETGVDDHVLVNDISADEYADGDSINVYPGAAISSPDYFANGYGQVDFMGNLFGSTSYSDDKAAALASIFTVGAHPYVLDYFSTSPGINVRRDIMNEQWMSLYEEQPASSNFVVTESIAGTSISGPTRNVKGTFNCLIFNSDGESKTVEDGSFFLRFLAP